MITVDDYAKAHGLNRSTAYRRLERMVRDGTATRHPGWVEHRLSLFSDVRMPPSGRINYYRIKAELNNPTK